MKDGDYNMSKTYNIQVQVTGNIEKSLRQLKKKSEREGVIRDMKRQVYYEPPTQKRRKKLMRAIKSNFLKNAEHLLYR
jgi:small subunit ribosomal protein S21